MRYEGLFLARNYPAFADSPRHAVWHGIHRGPRYEAGKMNKRQRKKFSKKKPHPIAVLLDQARQNIAKGNHNPVTFQEAWARLQGAMGRMSLTMQAERRCWHCEGALVPHLLSWICPACDIPPYEGPDASKVTFAPYLDAYYDPTMPLLRKSITDFGAYLCDACGHRFDRHTDEGHECDSLCPCTIFIYQAQRWIPS